MIFSVDGGSFDWRNYEVIVKLIHGDEEWWNSNLWAAQILLRAALNLSLGVFVMKEDYKQHLWGDIFNLWYDLPGL